MNKKFAIGLIVLILGVLVLSSCAQNRGTGYATYGNTLPPKITGSGGGCGVGAPSVSNDGIETIKTAQISNVF